MGESARHHAGRGNNGIGMASALAVLADDQRRSRPAGSAADHDRRSRHGRRRFGLRGQRLQADDPDQSPARRSSAKIPYGLRAGGIGISTPLTGADRRSDFPPGSRAWKSPVAGLSEATPGGDIHAAARSNAKQKLLSRFLAGHADGAGSARVWSISNGGGAALTRHPRDEALRYCRQSAADKADAAGAGGRLTGAPLLKRAGGQREEPGGARGSGR